MKKIAFLGDSITAGAGAENESDRFTDILCRKLDCICLNYGVSGTRIAKQTIPSDEPIYDQDFIERAKTIENDVDLVFVFGGTNDYGHGDANFGDLNSTSPYTFYGAVKTLINYLTERYGKDKVVFILPLLRYDENNVHGEFGTQKKERPPLKEYRKAIINVCKMFNVKYYSLNDVFTLPKVNTGDALTVDGLHPNKKGHMLIAEFLCNKIIEEKLFR